MFHLMFSYRKHFVRTLCVLTTSTNGRIFAISTFNTDYILTKKENFQNEINSIDDLLEIDLLSCDIAAKAVKIIKGE